MVIVRGCSFPDDLLYDVPNHTWYRPERDGLVRVGMTQVAIALAREVLVFTPKRAGRSFEAQRSIATIESAKWIGVVRAAFDGEVALVNEGLVARPTTANHDCYGDGWLMLVRPANDNWQANLVTGAAIGPAYEAWMEREAYPGCAGS
jgi:glycine cleavage system H protein